MGFAGLTAPAAGCNGNNEVSPSAGSNPVLVSAIPSCRKRSLRQMRMLNFRSVKVGHPSRNMPGPERVPANLLQERANSCKKSLLQRDAYGS